jgi:hypothetical protein
MWYSAFEQTRTTCDEHCLRSDSDMYVLSLFYEVFLRGSLINEFKGGELFVDRLPEQQAILDMLNYSDKKHAWPTIDIQERLKESWGWHTPSISSQSCDMNLRHEFS